MRATGSRLIIELQQPKTQTKSGVFIPVSSANKVNKIGKVLSAGPNVKYVNEGDLVRMHVGADLGQYVTENIVSVFESDIELVL